jgi:probable phosphoglycerate mutase
MYSGVFITEEWTGKDASVARTQLYLVRHGEQDPASDHAANGGLSQLGREQADRLGRRLCTVPFSAIHHSPLARAAQTADIVARRLPHVPRHNCDFVVDRTPVPSAAQRGRYPARWHAWLDAVPDDERDEDAVALRAAVAHFGVTGEEDRYELLITHNFVTGWFVRHVFDAPVWRWIGLNQANCAITIVQWDSDRPPTLVSFNDTGHL